MRTYKCKVENSLWHCSKGFCDGCDYASCGNDCDKQLLKDVYQEHISDERMIEQQRIKMGEQQAEIERLQEENKSIRYCYEQAKSYNDTLAESCEKNCKKFNMTTRAEAIKEFAERLKAEVSHIPAWGSVAEKKIDNLVKEMTEQKGAEADA